MLLNLIAALAWAVVMLALGYGLGSTVEAALGDIKRVERKIMAAAVVFAVFIVTGRWLARRWRS